MSSKRYFASIHFKEDTDQYETLRMTLIDHNENKWHVGDRDGRLHYDKERDKGEWLSGTLLYKGEVCCSDSDYEGLKFNFEKSDYDKKVTQCAKECDFGFKIQSWGYQQCHCLKEGINYNSCTKNVYGGSQHFKHWYGSNDAWKYRSGYHTFALKKEFWYSGPQFNNEPYKLLVKICFPQNSPSHVLDHGIARSNNGIHDNTFGSVVIGEVTNTDVDSESGKVFSWQKRTADKLCCNPTHRDKLTLSHDDNGCNDLEMKCKKCGQLTSDTIQGIGEKYEINIRTGSYKNSYTCKLFWTCYEEIGMASRGAVEESSFEIIGKVDGIRKTSESFKINQAFPVNSKVNSHQILDKNFDEITELKVYWMANDEWAQNGVTITHQKNGKKYQCTYNGVLISRSTTLFSCKLE